jgi:cephalosporin-C deacetylase-like acetyl esterase
LKNQKMGACAAKIRRSTWALLFAGLCAVPNAGRGEVVVKQAADKSVTVSATAYTAHIDANGNLSELSVKGVKAFSHKFGDPGKPPAEKPAINVSNTLVAIRAGEKRVEWNFGEELIRVVTEGYSFEAQLDPSIKAIILPDGKGGPAYKSYEGSSALVLSNDLTVAYSIPFHAGRGRLVPTGYCNGSKKPGSVLEWDFKLGVPVDALQMLSALEVKPVDSSYGSLLNGGNDGSGMVHFPENAAIVFETVQRNLSAESQAIGYRLVVLDHQVAGKPVATLNQTATLPASGVAKLRWDVPRLPPGFYYLTASASSGDKKFTETLQTFAVDLTNFRHPLTRPSDFSDFWARQNAALAAAPPNPKLTLISAPDNPNKAYEVILDMPGGSKLQGCLVVPAKIGNGPAQLSSVLTEPLNEIMRKAKSADFSPEDHVDLNITLPGDGRYLKWKDATDNNLLECALAYLRAIDFLAARPEVKPGWIMVNGASRSGGLTLIAAALRPNNVCAANGFVPTSFGLSWEDKLYRGWGKCPDAKDPVAAKRFCEEAAYVDPVNFAPDVKCPVIFAYGIDDGLSPPQGIEVAYHLTASPWKRISRDSGGHQFSVGCQKSQREMMDFLGTGGAAGPDQERTLKDH